MPHHLLTLWSRRRDVLAYTNAVKALSPIAYWPLAETSGTTATDESGNGRNGSYTAVTLGQPGIGDGRTAASFNGSASYCNIYSVGLWGAINGSEGTLALWSQVSGSGVWTDGTIREMTRLRPNSGGNIVIIRRTATNNQLEWFYQAGGTTKNVFLGSQSATTWMHLALTWSKSADQMKAYLNGVQVGSTQTGLGVWDSTLNATNQTIVGAATNTPTSIWSGSLAHVAIWTTPLSATQIVILATLR